MDFDGDGKLDLISGSYDPGTFHLARGLGAGQFAEIETIRNHEGKPLLIYPDQTQAFESFGSFVAPVDWDADGDLDLLLGGFAGEMKVCWNEGSRTQPAYSDQHSTVMAGGEPLEVKTGHASPVVADWDGDGLWDVLSGAANGSVVWFRNAGTLGSPQLEPPRFLLPPHEGSGFRILLSGDNDAAPGIRTQITVVDYNRDGKLDLLVGDFCTTIQLRADLTQEQVEEYHRLTKELEANSKQTLEMMERLKNDFNERYPGRELFSDEATRRWFEEYRELTESDAFVQLREASAKMRETLTSYLQPVASADEPGETETRHGYVWLLLRK